MTANESHVSVERTCDFYPKEYHKGGKTITVMIILLLADWSQRLDASLEEIRCRV